MSPQAQAGLTEYQAVPAQLCWTCWPLGFYCHSLFPWKPHFWSCDSLQDAIQHPIPWDSLQARPLCKNLSPGFNQSLTPAMSGRGQETAKDHGINDITQSVVFPTEKFLFNLKPLPIFLIHHTSKDWFTLR